MKTDLLRYLLWGMTTTPARFGCLADFEAWTADMGFDTADCAEVWAMLEGFPRNVPASLEQAKKAGSAAGCTNATADPKAVRTAA